MEDQVQSGGCFCGAVRYAVAGEPEGSSVCHCVSCRRASGAPSVAWLTFPLVSFSLVSGEPVEHPSSEGVIRAHCGGCGTSLTYRREDDAGRMGVTTPAWTFRTGFRPRTTRGWRTVSAGRASTTGCRVSREANRRARGPKRNRETNWR